MHKLESNVPYMENRTISLNHAMSNMHLLKKWRILCRSGRYQAIIKCRNSYFYGTFNVSMKVFLSNLKCMEILGSDSNLTSLQLPVAKQATLQTLHYKNILSAFRLFENNFHWSGFQLIVESNR